MMLARCGITLLFSLASSSLLAASYYKCTDANGKVTFGQVPCGGVLDEATAAPAETAVAPAASVPSPSGAPDRAVRVTYPAPEGSETAARAAIALKLKDPDSLQVRNVVAKGISPDPAKWSICGEYNARNSFGGYVGFHQFAYFDGKAFLGGDDIENILVKAVCE